MQSDVAGSEVIGGMAMLGKTAFSLLFIVALILALSYLLKRLRGPGNAGSALMKLVASSSLGPKERVVVMEIEGTWLVLGVGGGRISKLHETPARENAADAGPVPPAADFARRLSGALARGRAKATGARGPGA